MSTLWAIKSLSNNLITYFVAIEMKQGYPW
jgi:hypothetical protein